MGWEGPELQEEPGRARLCPGVSGCSRASQPRASSPWEPRDPPSPPRGTQPVTSVGCVCYPKGWGFSPLLFSLRAVPFAATQRRQLPLSARSVGTEAPPRPGAACAPSPPLAPQPRSLRGACPRRRGVGRACTSVGLLGGRTCSACTHTQAPAVVWALPCPLPSAPAFACHRASCPSSCPSSRPSGPPVHMVHTRQSQQQLFNVQESA